MWSVMRFSPSQPLRGLFNQGDLECSLIILFHLRCVGLLY
uniref:Uncharacterized protein n=1 Tax=Anguilla anguilla TaxID=7936 RepID=A0A0E9VPN5_ANGAN